MDNKVESWLSEFRALRDEIQNRSRVQQALVALNMSALATILGIAFSLPEWWDPSILLVIPFLSSLLSLLYLNHDFTIATLGHYIRDRIRPKLCELTGDAEIMGWELWIRDVPRKSKIPREMAFHLAAPVLYIAPCIIALKATYDIAFSTEGYMLRTTWIAGLILAALNIGLWCYRYKYWGGKASEKTKES